MNFVKRLFGGLLAFGSAVLASVRAVLKLVAIITLVFILTFALGRVARSDWHYAYHEGVIMRSWCVKLPGVQEYFDINDTPPTKRWEFSLWVPYRVSRWYPTEEDDNEHVSPNGAEPDSFVYAAEAWAIHQGLTVPLEAVQPGMFQGMLDDFADSPAGKKFK